MKKKVTLVDSLGHVVHEDMLEWLPDGINYKGRLYAICPKSIQADSAQYYCPDYVSHVRKNIRRVVQR